MANNKIKKEILEINAFGEEFRICRNLKYLPLTAYPSYIQTGLIVFCLKGSARINIHDNEHLLSENQLAVFFPGQLISCRDISDDFLTLTLSLSSTFYDDILSGMRRFSPPVHGACWGSSWLSPSPARRAAAQTLPTRAAWDTSAT